LERKGGKGVSEKGKVSTKREGSGEQGEGALKQKDEKKLIVGGQLRTKKTSADHERGPKKGSWKKRPLNYFGSRGRRN